METAKYVIQAFGITLFVVFLALLVWSLSRPPVTEGPMPPMPALEQPATPRN